MIRKIIKIDEEKCNGCGACAEACHEGAIEMVNGKARLTRDDYCDGLGDCLPVCPVDAISFEEREAAAYDEAAVKANMALEEREIRGLLDQLLLLDNPFTCPHGRPTAVKMTKNDLEKILKKLTNLKLELGGGDAATTASPVRQSIASKPEPLTAAATSIAPAPMPLYEEAPPPYIPPLEPPSIKKQQPIEEPAPKEESQLDDLESSIALRKRVEQHPLVQEVLSTFGGMIRGVKK